MLRPDNLDTNPITLEQFYRLIETKSKRNPLLKAVKLTSTLARRVNWSLKDMTGGYGLAEAGIVVACLLVAGGAGVGLATGMIPKDRPYTYTIKEPIPLADANYGKDSAPRDLLQEYLNNQRPDGSLRVVRIKPLPMLASVNALAGVKSRPFPSIEVTEDKVEPVDTPLGYIDTLVVDTKGENIEPSIWITRETDEGRRFLAVTHPKEGKQYLIVFQDPLSREDVPMEAFLSRVHISSTLSATKK